MDCRQVESQLAMLSAEALPAATALQMREHLTHCRSCEQEWRVFQSTLLVLSTTTQVLPTPAQSEQLWQRCAEEIFERVEQRRLAGAAMMAPGLTAMAPGLTAMAPGLTAPAPGLSVPGLATPGLTPAGPGWLSWVRNQPRWGWVALGSAVAVLGGAWWFSPQDGQPVLADNSGTQIAEVAPDQSLLPPPDANGAFPGRLITFQRPPAMASSMVDNHTAMTFAPFIDHVATLVISSSATDGPAAPLAREVRPAGQPAAGQPAAGVQH